MNAPGWEDVLILPPPSLKCVDILHITDYVRPCTQSRLTRHVKDKAGARPRGCDMRVLQNARPMGPSERSKVILVVSTHKDSKPGPGPAFPPSVKTEEKHKGGRGT